MGFFGKMLGIGAGNFERVVNMAPNQVGVYIAKLDGKVVYVGRAIENRPGQSPCGLRKRLQEHWRGASAGKGNLYQHRDSIDISIKPCSSVDEAKQLEARLIRQHDTVANGWNDRYED
jgi:excinuclease UvrABC nuclease subunit